MKRFQTNWRIMARALGIVLFWAGSQFFSLAAQAQIIAVGPPSFQAYPSRSYETDLLNRLALSGGQYSPDDLVPLVRLTWLESMSMLAVLRHDVPRSPLFDQLEAEIQTFWIVAEDLDASLRSAAAEDTAPERLGQLYEQIDISYRQLAGTLGEFPARACASRHVSPRSPS